MTAPRAKGLGLGCFCETPQATRKTEGLTCSRAACQEGLTRTFRIKEVLDNSPASEAGLQKNDLITKVDGKPAAELTLTKIGEMFERPATYKLTVRRAEQTLQVKLTPRKLV